MSEVNEQLRAHVTRVGFSLSLGKTHIARLVQLDVELKQNVSTQDMLRNYQIVREPRVFNQFVVGTHGLMERGLIQHIAEVRRRPGESISAMTPRRVWRITPAGRLVINLLKEAGIYQEYAAMLPALVPKVASA